MSMYVYEGEGCVHEVLSSSRGKKAKKKKSHHHHYHDDDNSSRMNQKERGMRSVMMRFEDGNNKWVSICTSSKRLLSLFEHSTDYKSSRRRKQNRNRNLKSTERSCTSSFLPLSRFIIYSRDILQRKSSISISHKHKSHRSHAPSFDTSLYSPQQAPHS